MKHMIKHPLPGPESGKLMHDDIATMSNRQHIQAILIHTHDHTTVRLRKTYAKKPRRPTQVLRNSTLRLALPQLEN